MVPISDALFLIAELAVAFAGFASLVAIIGRRRGRDDPIVDAYRIKSMLECALGVAAFSLVPILLHESGVSHQSSFRLSAGLFAAFALLFLIHWGRRGRDLSLRVPGWGLQNRAWRYTVGILSGSAILTLLAAGLGWVGPPRSAYLWGLYAHLALSGLLFLRLVQSLLETNRNT